MAKKLFRFALVLSYSVIKIFFEKFLGEKIACAFFYEFLALFGNFVDIISYCKEAGELLQHPDPTYWAGS